MFDDLVQQLMDALTIQWAVDSAKKPSITDAYRYNTIVTAVNALNSVGTWPADLDSQTAWSLISGWFASHGYVPIAELMGDNEAGWATYPVATI